MKHGKRERRWWAWSGMLTLLCCLACAAAPEPRASASVADLPATAQRTPRPGSTVARVEFVTAYENTPDQPFFPVEGMGGCAYSPDGSLLFTDEKRGKVYGLAAATNRWFEFEAPSVRPYQPIDVAVDGFKVMVLDMGSALANRFDLNGAFLDVLVDVRKVDPVIQSTPNAFAVDSDGRMAIADVSQQQVLLLDTFQNLTMRIGDPGSLPDQFAETSGVTFLPDGSLLVADRGNRRLALYGRLGFFEALVGGDSQADNPFLAPMGLAADRYGNVFVADMGKGLVHLLGKRLAYEMSFGHQTDSDSGLLAPTDVAVGPDGKLAVADRDRAAVVVYQIIYQ